MLINIYFLLKTFSLSEEKEYAIDDSDIVLEKYPLIISPIKEAALVRVP
jgi:KUP system potassium uptake protein